MPAGIDAIALETDLSESGVRNQEPQVRNAEPTWKFPQVMTITPQYDAGLQRTFRDSGCEPAAPNQSCLFVLNRAALDFAIRSGIPHGGYCPRRRRSESGRIAPRYRLIECAAPGYTTRTALNVAHSNGTLILTRGRPEGGTRRTLDLCIAHGKPSLIIDLDHALEPKAFAPWLRAHRIAILNVAGPRESKQSGIGKQTRKALETLFAALHSDETVTARMCGRRHPRV